METNDSMRYQDFSNSYSDDINSYISGVISIIFNVLLIISTNRIKSYTKPVRFSMFSSSILRLIFSISVMLTVPSIIYSKSITSLYIVKNGYSFPIPLGDVFLAFFVAFIVMSCNLPAVQYLQVASLLSSSTRKEISYTISIIPVFVVISSLILIYFGYIPPFYEIHISSLIKEKMAEQGETAFLIVTCRLYFDPTSASNTFQLLSQICTLFTLIVMFISIIIVITCYIYIQKQMKIRFSVSSNSKKAQEQLNMVLALQFILPFTTIHIPYYIIVIFPFFGLTAKVLADRVLYLFSWCPAINPILVILMVKNIRDQLIPQWLFQKKRVTNKNSQAQSKSKVVIVSL